ncbi:helix-turn-helix domain-containing protein [Legionella sp.]
MELARILNISQTNLSAMENGRRPIGKELAKRIAEKFEIDYRNFL